MAEIPGRKKPFNRRQRTQRPERIETAQDRGQAFEAYLHSHNLSRRDFAALSGISYSLLGYLTDGSSDIADMRQPTVEKFLAAHDISDREAWDYYGIPEEKRRQWRTFRPPPLGHGEAPSHYQDIRLREPLQGKIGVEAGSYITIDPHQRLTGVVVVEREDGSLWALPADMAKGQGKVLGQLIATHHQ